MGKVNPQLLARHHSSKNKRQLNIKWYDLTYLVVGDTLKLFVWNVLANGWHAERAMPILLCPHNVSAVGLHRLTEIMVGHNLFFIWLTMDAPCSIPRILALHILNSVNKIRSPICLSLSQILADS